MASVSWLEGAMTSTGTIQGYLALSRIGTFSFPYVPVPDLYYYHCLNEFLSYN